MSAEDVVRERFPDLDPGTGPGAARRWRRLVRLAGVAEEYRTAQEAGEKAPATVVAEKRGVTASNVYAWLHHARREGFAAGARTRVASAGDTVRRNVRILRERRRMNQEALAAKMSEVGRPMLPTVISKAERGDRRIDVDDLVAFAAALGVSVVQLLDPSTGCSVCRGTPPPGFTCDDCGTTTKAT